MAGAGAGVVVRKLMSSTKTGVVVSSGKMDRAVKVRIAGQEWNKQIRKFFPSFKTYLVADPTYSARTGDIVRIASGHRTSKHIRHCISAIISPFGPPMNERPPVPTPEEHHAKRERLRLEKDVRQAARGRRASIQRIEEARKAGYYIPTLEEAMKSKEAGEDGTPDKTSRGKERLMGKGDTLPEGGVKGSEKLVESEKRRVADSMKAGDAQTTKETLAAAGKELKERESTEPK